MLIPGAGYIQFDTDKGGLIPGAGYIQSNEVGSVSVSLPSGSLIAKLLEMVGQAEVCRSTTQVG